MRPSFAISAFLVAGVVFACSSPDTEVGPDSTLDTAKLDPGALVSVTMPSTVGVLLDEIPASMRDRVAASLLARPSSFWTARAHRQIVLTYYRLVFRPEFYPPGGGTNTGKANPITGSTQKQQLPLPPESQWNITLSGAAKRQTIDGHDLVTVDYNLATTILTDVNSPGASEPSLANGGGSWNEPFTFPVDPELVFQRTRFACLDEAEFPPGSVDSEEVDSFYDQTCTAENNLSSTGCHQTELPPWSCVDALKGRIGHVDTKLKFTRLKWDPALADSVRSGPITIDPKTNGADLLPEAAEFRVNRVTYRYIAPNDCAIQEKCVGGTGWRKLLQFSTADRNTGTTALNIGYVDYFNQDGGSSLSQHNVFEYSACHKHYHFTHYGTFSFGGNESTTSKRGFCLQSTNRLSNNEFSPLHNPYPDCHVQGVEVGWVDEYKAGLPCQWLDVTSLGPVTGDLKFDSNPDGFLCEGTPVLDANGNQTWKPSGFTAPENGLPQDMPVCNYVPKWHDNNVDAYSVSLPTNGDGYVTKPCDRGQIGPLRNCGMTNDTPKKPASCTPGAKTTVHCTLPVGAAPQVVRVCEASRALGAGVACTFQDALANTSVDSKGADVTFNCPGARDSVETGGTYGLYTAPVFPDDAAAVVSCQ
ncbi:MAG TPA: lysyl oxidase family protein [Labilithrix sp.]|jgi:hypothetical protein